MRCDNVKKKKNFGEIGSERNAIVWWILCVLFYPIQFVWAYLCWVDIKKFTEKDINPVIYLILMLIPIVNLVILYMLCSNIKEMQALAGVPDDEQINPIMVFILMCCFGIGIILAQNGINKTWEYANK